MTNNFVIFGAGILAGYLLVDYLKGTKVQCPASIDCMPGGGTRHPYCTNMPTECVGITRTTQ